jgi:hypothetical protein
VNTSRPLTLARQSCQSSHCPAVGLLEPGSRSEGVHCVCACRSTTGSRSCQPTCQCRSSRTAATSPCSPWEASSACLTRRPPSAPEVLLHVHLHAYMSFASATATHSCVILGARWTGLTLYLTPIRSVACWCRVEHPTTQKPTALFCYIRPMGDIAPSHSPSASEFMEVCMTGLKLCSAWA